MKRLSIILFLTILGELINAQEFTINQTYYPFPDSNAVWSEDYNMDESPWRINHLFGLLNQDTIIDSIKYHKLFSFSDTIFTQENATYIGGIREDSLKKVYYKGKNVFEPYICDLHPDREKLLYDFSLNVGDTFRLIHSYSYFCQDSSLYSYLVVSKIDSLLINNKYRKRICFGSCDFVSWVEGIGGVPRGLLYTSDPVILTCNLNNTLICFKQNDTLLYGNCYYHYYDIKENKTFEKNIKIYPNPVTDISTFDTGKFNNIEFINIYSLEGILIKQINTKGRNKIIISRKNYLPGMYFYRAKSSKRKYFNGRFIIL